ncbi:hypothetical protein ACIP88_02475 [Streptomyces uncialis]|uniref:hypothetical protein n=1 Tax=Streptomyces uncialis TaxID=1048205 RepID=UPI0038274921
MALTHRPPLRRPRTPGASALTAGALTLLFTAVAFAGAQWGTQALHGILPAVAACAVGIAAGFSLSGSV